MSSMKIDVEEGDRFTNLQGSLLQYRGGSWRHPGAQWNVNYSGTLSEEIALPRARALEILRLYGYEITTPAKPDYIEIDPPEWGVRCPASGKIALYETENLARYETIGTGLELVRIRTAKGNK